MVEIVDCSSWVPYEGNTEGSGRSEKQWLVAANGDVGLFKYPKFDPTAGGVTYEHVSEHLAYKLGEQLGVSTARVDLAVNHGRIGSISYLIVGENETLYEGLQFVLGMHPNYDADRLYDPSTNEKYSIKHIFEVINHEPVRDYWIRMLLFDFLIGNSDRHQSNWAFIISRGRGSDASEFSIRPCPLYDNGSSLCCYVRDDKVLGFLGNDLMKLRSLVDTKSLSLVRIDPRSKKKPRHSDIVRFLLSNYSSALPMAESFLQRLDHDSVRELVNVYQDDLVSPNRRRLLIRFLEEKTRILSKLVMENRHA